MINTRDRGTSALNYLRKIFISTRFATSKKNRLPMYNMLYLCFSSYSCNIRPLINTQNFQSYTNNKHINTYPPYFRTIKSKNRTIL